MSGSSVRISTTTSPVTPCALATRPTTRSIRALLVGVHHVDADAAAPAACDQRAQRGCGATAAADDLAEVVRVHVHLDGATATAGHHVDPDIVRIVHDAADQVLHGVNDDRAHGRGQLSVFSVAPSTVASAPSAAGSDSSLTGATSASAEASASAFSAFLAGAFFFLGVVASVLGPPSASASAALNRSSLD